MHNRPPMPEPRHMTPLIPGDKSLLPATARMMNALGKPPLPWQKSAIAGSTAINPETGTFRYSRVVVTTPRQVGKTTEEGSVSMANILHLGKNRRAWFTAQDGTKARETFRSFMDDFEKTPYRHALSRVMRGNGAELIQGINGGEYRPFVPNEESLHGKQADLVGLDEVWIYSKKQGQNMIQAVDAPMSTRRALTGHEPQLRITSTEGTTESEWYNPILDQLRTDPDPETFFIDFGLRPDDDPDDLRTVASRHPGYGWLFDLDSLRKRQAAYKGDTAGFARAYGNVRTGATSRVISAERWNTGRTAEMIPAEAPVCLAAAVGVDDSDAAITMTGYHPTRGKITEIVRGGHDSGSSWVLMRLKEIQANAGKPIPVVIAERGTSAHLHDMARRAGLPLVENATDLNYSVACASVMAGLETGEFAFRTHPALEAAAEHAARRWVQDGAWLWGRRSSTGSIAALEAATWSAWGIDHLPEETGLQLFT